MTDRGSIKPRTLLDEYLSGDCLGKLFSLDTPTIFAAKELKSKLGLSTGYTNDYIHAASYTVLTVRIKNISCTGSQEGLLIPGLAHPLTKTPTSRRIRDLEKHLQDLNDKFDKRLEACTGQQSLSDRSLRKDIEATNSEVKNAQAALETRTDQKFRRISQTLTEP